ncbi:MAG TPA: PQQ-dependent sugar dehydrogenase [Ktedonobacteraceae bacterium]|nr:PQQ-dependent sugar dehydrogenase [Ktedonobacteraceae bacterium]
MNMHNSAPTLDQAPKPRRVKRWQIFLAVLLLLVLAIGSVALYINWHTVRSIVSSNPAGGEAKPANLQLPAGFQMSIFASGLNAPRFMAIGPDGTLFVANRGANTIVALPDPQHTGKAIQKMVVASGLSDPTSLDFYQQQLYVGESSTVTRFTLDDQYHTTSKQVLISNLPIGGHSTRTVLIGPDNHLYVSTGSSCNVCNETEPHRATVWQYQMDGSDGHMYAKGLRNAVGMAVNPWNKQIWVTNNGRDLLGDDIPPETVYALQDGGNYGWPSCHAGTIIDPDFGSPNSCNGVIKPVVAMQAHSAPLGLAFYNANQFPQQYHGLFVAFHGSWNRSTPTGYKVVFIPLNARGEVSGPLQDFITGWLQKNDASGRPVGVIVGADGALYVSDDKAGLIYRITYHG